MSCERFGFNYQNFQMCARKALQCRTQTRLELVLARVAPNYGVPVQKFVRRTVQGLTNSQKRCQIGLASTSNVVAIAAFGEPRTSGNLGVCEAEIAGERAKGFS